MKKNNVKACQCPNCNLFYNSNKYDDCPWCNGFNKNEDSIEFLKSEGRICVLCGDFVPDEYQYCPRCGTDTDETSYGCRHHGPVVPTDFVKQKDFCRKYISLLKTFYLYSNLKEYCIKYDAYSRTSAPEQEIIGGVFYSTFMSEAYDNIMYGAYKEIIETSNLKRKDIENPSKEFLEKLSDIEMLSCISWHIRADRFSEGSLVNNAIGNGILLKYFIAWVYGENEFCTSCGAQLDGKSICENCGCEVD